MATVYRYHGGTGLLVFPSRSMHFSNIWQANAGTCAVLREFLVGNVSIATRSASSRGCGSNWGAQAPR